MENTSYKDLIQKRKVCSECKEYGLCEDLTQRHTKGKLYLLETALEKRFPVDSLGLWDPLNNSNPLTASVLIVGQDFSHAGYLCDLNSLSEIYLKESNNITNKNLIKYVKSIPEIDEIEIYCSNAVLCIKSGNMNSPVRSHWLENCSQTFLKPLITENLKNLKMIITLGKVALDAIKIISDFRPGTEGFSSIPGNSYYINIGNKYLKLYPMFHTGGLGYANARRVRKNPADLWSAISLE